MKLYYSPGACSLAPHIVAREAGVSIEPIKVDLKTHQTAHGEDYYAISPRGYVPSLKLDNGTVLTETSVLVQYLADQNPPSGLLPACGTLERVKVQQWLAFISTELHKTFGPLWQASAPAETVKSATDKLLKRVAEINTVLAHQAYLTGDQFCVADAYLFVVGSWMRMKKLDLAAYPNFSAFLDRVVERPKVQDAMRAEGLIK